MKKILAVGLILPLLLSARAYATGSYSLVSGPHGGQIGANGWYLYYNEMPKITISSGAGSSCGGTGTWELPLNLGGGDSLGAHTLRVFYAPSDSKDNLWVSRDGVLLGTMCNQDTSYTGSTTTVWEGVIKFDAAPPFVGIDSSLNNSNTNKPTITITGSAFDTDTNDEYPIGSPGKQKCFSTNRCSVLSSVTVNGVAAKISGETFSADVPLNKGLNTITATAIDNAGQSRKSASITVLRSDEVTSNGPANQGTTSSSGQGSNQDKSDNQSKNNEKATAEPAEQAKEENVIEQIPTPVKAAGGAGIGLGAASAMGWVPYRKIGSALMKLFTGL